MPHDSSAINAVRFVTFADTKKLLSLVSFANSVLANFFIKIEGRSNVHSERLGLAQEKEN